LQGHCTKIKAKKRIMIAAMSGTIEGNYKQFSIEVAPERCKWWNDCYRRRKSVPGTCGCGSHRKHSVAICWTACRRDDQSWRCSRPEMTMCRLDMSDVSCRVSARYGSAVPCSTQHLGLIYELVHFTNIVLLLLSLSLNDAMTELYKETYW